MSHADRNLLFGILAVQMDFVGRDALIAAMHAWILERSKPLGQILVEQQALSLRGTISWSNWLRSTWRLMAATRRGAWRRPMGSASSAPS